MRKLSFLLFTLPLLAVSCKDKNKPTSVCTTSPSSCQKVTESKDFFLFKMGSWWVYEEETSHVRDSVYMTQSIEVENSYDFDVRMKSALSGYEYHYWPVYYGVNNNCSVTNPVDKRCLYILRSKYKFQDFLVESHVFFIKYSTGESVATGDGFPCGNSNNRILMQSVWDTYSLNGQNFGKTIRIDEGCDCAEGKQPTRMFYSKNVGVIRKELLDSNQVWNLVNYHIVQ